MQHTAGPDKYYFILDSELLKTLPSTVPKAIENRQRFTRELFLPTTVDDLYVLPGHLILQLPKSRRWTMFLIVFCNVYNTKKYRHYYGYTKKKKNMYKNKINKTREKEIGIGNVKWVPPPTFVSKSVRKGILLSCR